MSGPTAGAAAGGGRLEAEPAPPDELARSLGHAFARPELLACALTHASWANERGPRGTTYERLEFLGDAVLSVLVSEALYVALPQAPEGVLSRLRAEVVREQSLAELAASLELPRYVRLGQGQRDAGLPPSVLADVFEAVVAALYLDGGLDACRAALQSRLAARLAEAQQVPTDAKTSLQELCHARGLLPPQYVLVAETGPMHARAFEVHVALPPLAAQVGVGPSKKQAEQRAALAAFRLLLDRR